jgi:acetyl-CoA carboxylase biotin carboxyl carrier protein
MASAACDSGKRGSVARDHPLGSPGKPALQPEFTLTPTAQAGYLPAARPDVGRRPGGQTTAMCAASNPGDIFDVKKVRRLIELMKEHDLSELDLKQADNRVRIRRGGEVVAYSAPAPAAHRPAGPAAEPAPAKESAAEGRMLVIKSPMVGTFYKASGPDSAPFVKVGDRIGPEKTVCIVEAMKVFNEIPAGVSGQVVAILVENGAPVEFGQPLIKVDPEG